MKLNNNFFNTYNYKPNRARILTAIKGGIPDKVPLFDNYIGEEIVEKILGYEAGNTCAAVGDPFRGDERAIVDGDVCIPMNPNDYIKLCNIICQDTIMLENAFVPYRIYNENGEKVIKPSKKDIENKIFYLKSYKDALKDTDIALTVQTGNFFLTHYHNLNGSNFFTMIYDDPLLVEEMLTVSTDYYLNYTKEALKLGFDIYMAGDDVAYKTGLMINPKHFRKLYEPFAKKIFEPVLNAGIPIIFDCDGNPTEIIDFIIDLGCSCLFPIDSNGMDYKEVKKKFGKRISLYGAIDTDPLIRKTVLEVENYVKEVVLTMKKNGGYIAGTVSSVNEIPFENYVVMINTIHKFGQY